MLRNTFYFPLRINHPASGEQPRTLSANLRLNPDHPVFNGHFPGNPVVPGVCQIQIIRELLEDLVGSPLKLTSSDVIKFPSMINPVVNQVIGFTLIVKDLPDHHWSVNATIHDAETIFMKFRGVFTI